MVLLKGDDMKRGLFQTATAILLLFSSSAACTTLGETGVEADQYEMATAAQSDSDGGDMSLAMKLALGTFKLEETEHPITTELAQTLLPLWKAISSLSESETTTAQEIDAIVSQIQASMMSEQILAIDAMGLTDQDMASVAGELGLELGDGRFGEMDPELQASGMAPPDGLVSGQFGDQQGSFAALSPEQQQAAMEAREGLGQSGLGVPVPVLEAVIEFLENKAR
jgi:hypothetical protein